MTSLDGFPALFISFPDKKGGKSSIIVEDFRNEDEDDDDGFLKNILLGKFSSHWIMEL